MNGQRGNHFLVFARGSSLRRRVAYSLAIVRLILVPVIFLAVFYLFRMGWIVDRIVNVDAPAATLAGHASIEMLQARRSERNYLLLHDPSYLRENRDSVAKVEQTLNSALKLKPEDRASVQMALDALHRYEEQIAAAVSALEQPGQEPSERLQAVVRAYENELNDLLKKGARENRAKLIDEVRNRVNSFDAEISKAIRQGNPALGRIAPDLQSSSEEILKVTGQLEARNWQDVEEDHQKARDLLHEAEWALGSVSAVTFLLSVWISFILPRQVVQPLVSLKEAVDRAAAGNDEVEFDIQGEGELVQLAKSVRNLVARLHPAS